VEVEPGRVSKTRTEGVRVKSTPVSGGGGVGIGRPELVAVALLVASSKVEAGVAGVWADEKVTR